MPVYEKSQVVKVPELGFEGRISGVLDFVDQEACYQIKWLDASMAVQLGVFKESEVILAQKRKPDATLKVDVDSSALQAATVEVEKMAAAARECEATINRIPRNVLNLRRSKSRSKRK